MKKIVLTLFVAFLFTACETGVISDANSTNSTNTAQESGIVALIDEKPSFEDEGFDTDLHPIILDDDSVAVTDATVQAFEGGIFVLLHLLNRIKSHVICWGWSIVHVALL